MLLNDLLEMSHRYGANGDYVLAGGGNTSYKENGIMHVKGSGTELATITAEQFVAMDVEKLLSLAEFSFSSDLSEESREEKTLSAMMDAKLPGQESKRPSVEAVLHALFPYKYVLHVHPALVNGLACGKDGEVIFGELFGDEAVWIGLVKPGIILSQICMKAFNEYNTKNGKYPQLAILKNHGVFIAADSVVQIDTIMADMLNKLKKYIKKEPDFDDISFNRSLACSIAPALRMLYSGDGMATAVFCTNKQVMEFVSSAQAFETVVKPFTPDHMVYCEDEPMFIKSGVDLAKAFSEFEKRKGYKPKVVAAEGIGFFALGKNKKEAEQARLLFLDTIKVAVYTESFGGVLPLTDELIDFISNWEAESYRTRVSTDGSNRGRLEGRIALVTGGAQGFGKGLAESMADEGAYVTIADLNQEGAILCASGINAMHDQCKAIAVKADVTNAESVEVMIQETVLAFGGLDILLSNAGVLVSGGLDDLTEKSFDFMTDVNYKGYFLCTKYASIPMKIQHEYSPGYLTDIIEINSKSGLEGSNKNFAYAGTKFGGIGLTQSFAKELIEYGIKANAICPGNFFDGPLWTDPEKGLFRQYFEAGKIPGAKTKEDVRKFYENMVPMKRGCSVEDVACAVFYVVEQKYETGQAIPVTGGQVMLK